MSQAPESPAYPNKETPLSPHKKVTGPKSTKAMTALSVSKRHSKKKRQRDTFFSKKSMRRLCLLSGNIRSNKSVYERVEFLNKDFLEELLPVIQCLVEHRKGRTVTTKDVIYALRVIHRPMLN